MVYSQNIQGVTFIKKYIIGLYSKCITFGNYYATDLVYFCLISNILVFFTVLFILHILIKFYKINCIYTSKLKLDILT